MFKRLLKGTEFSQLLDMVSPAFFDVLPPRELWRQGREIQRRYGDDALYMRCLSERADLLDRAGIGVRIGSVGGPQQVASVQ